MNGIAGERFCVRNSGAAAVVEGVGDHACEYMTGGRAVILGKTGKNVGAGMSGGIAYIYDKDNKLEENLNTEMVITEFINERYEKEIKKYVLNHYEYTGSLIAKKIIKNWENEKNNFKVVISPEYKAVLEKGEER